MVETCDLCGCRRASDEVRGEFSMEENVVDKPKQWISVALHTDSDSVSTSKHPGTVDCHFYCHYSHDARFVRFLQ